MYARKTLQHYCYGICYFSLSKSCDIISWVTNNDPLFHWETVAIQLVGILDYTLVIQYLKLSETENIN